MSYYKITVPGVPPSLNKWSRMHWAKAGRLKKQWERDIFWLVRQQKIPRLNKARVRITYYFATGRRRDKDNYAPKFVMDGLVKAGVIEDDNALAVELLPVEFSVDKQEQRTEIEIWEVS